MWISHWKSQKKSISKKIVSPILRLSLRVNFVSTPSLENTAITYHISAIGLPDNASDKSMFLFPMKVLGAKIISSVPDASRVKLVKLEISGTNFHYQLITAAYSAKQIKVVKFIKLWNSRENKNRIRDWIFQTSESSSEWRILILWNYCANPKFLELSWIELYNRINFVIGASDKVEAKAMSQDFCPDAFWVSQWSHLISLEWTFLNE